MFKSIIFCWALFILAACNSDRCLECETSGRIDQQCFKTDAEYDTAVEAVCNMPGLDCYCPY